MCNGTARGILQRRVYKGPLTSSVRRDRIDWWHQTVSSAEQLQPSLPWTYGSPVGIDLRLLVGCRRIGHDEAIRQRLVRIVKEWMFGEGEGEGVCVCVVFERY